MQTWPFQPEKYLRERWFWPRNYFPALGASWSTSACFVFYFFIWKAETEKQSVIQSATIHWLTVQMPTTCGAKARSQRLSTTCRRQERNYLNYHCCLPGFSSRGSWSQELDPGIRPRNCDVAWKFHNWETESHPLNVRAHTHTHIFVFPLQICDFNFEMGGYFFTWNTRK